MYDFTFSRRLLFLVLSCSFLFPDNGALESQNWAPVGARWYYNQPTWDPPGVTFRLFESIGDSIIDGRLCSVVAGRCNCTYEMPEVNFLYEEDNRVFIYSSVTETFNLLYDFNLGPGESWTIHFDNGDSTQYTVDSVSYFVQGEDSLKVLHLDPFTSDFELGYTVTEKIGGSSCMYPMLGFCDPLTLGLRCYEDEELGLIQFDEFYACDYTPVEEIALEDIDVFPVPTMDAITISSSFQIRRLVIYDIQGVIQYEQGLNADFAEISMAAMRPGCYYLQLVGEEGIVYNKMIVKS